MEVISAGGEQIFYYIHYVYLKITMKKKIIFSYYTSIKLLGKNSTISINNNLLGYVLSSSVKMSTFSLLGPLPFIVDADTKILYSVSSLSPVRLA